MEKVGYLVSAPVFFVFEMPQVGIQDILILTTKLLRIDNDIFNRFFLCCDDLHFHIKATNIYPIMSLMFDFLSTLKHISY